MNSMLRGTLAAALVLASSLAQARDDRLQLSIADAMATTEAQAELAGTVAFYFSGQPHPEPLQRFATYTTNRKTNFFNKSDLEGCRHAFLSAMLALHEAAIDEGGNAVVDIHSVYRDKTFKSATEFECGAGNFVGGVSLRGTVVQLPEVPVLP